MVKESDSNFYLGGVNLIGVSIVVMVIGVVIFFMAIIGIIGAVGNFWPLLSLVSDYFIIICIY